MNSVAIIIILMISLIGIGSIFWIRTYYNPKTKQVNKALLLASLTSVLSSNDNNETETTTPTISRQSQITNNTETEYKDVFTGWNKSSGTIRNSLPKFFNKDYNGESRFESLKIAFKDSVKSDEKIENNLSPKIVPIETLASKSGNLNLNPSSRDTDTIITATAEQRMKLEEEKKKLEETKTKEDTTKQTTIEPLNTNTTSEEEYKSPDTQIKEAMKESEQKNTATPTQTFKPKENKEILELYNEHETLTPSDDFDFKNPDQKRIENASNKIDKFYERLTDISLNKITKKTKETYNEGTNRLQKTLHKDNDKTTETDTQSRFKTNNTPENDMVVTFNPEPQRPIKPVREEEPVKPKSNTPITAVIGNKKVSLKRGDSVIFNHNNETYSSLILDVKAGEVYVNYRRQRIWITTDKIKKKFD